MTPPRIHGIESARNPAFKNLRKLLGSRGIRKQGLALAAGKKIVADALRVVPDRCRGWITPGEELPPPPGVPAGLAWYRLAPALFRELDVFGVGAPLLLLSVPRFPSWDPRAGVPEGASLMLPFQDPENLGAAVRSAVAFGMPRVILLRESAHPYHPKAIRASAGAVLHADFHEGPALGDLPEYLDVVPLSGEGADIASFAFPERFALLPGLEGEGLPPRWRKRAVAVPIRPEVDSLNAAAATAVALYLWSRGASSPAAGSRGTSPR